MNINAISNQPVLNVADMNEWKNQVRSEVIPQNVEQVQNVAEAPPASASELSVDATVATNNIDFLA